MIEKFDLMVDSEIYQIKHDGKKSWKKQSDFKRNLIKAIRKRGKKEGFMPYNNFECSISYKSKPNTNMSEDTYELKKWYPSLPRDWEEGMRVGHGDRSPNTVAPVSSKYTTKWISLSEIRNSREFWVKVKKPTFKVINYSKGTLNNPDIFKVSSYTPLAVIKPNGEIKTVLDPSEYRIHSIERLFDSERFHLGNMVDYKEEAHEIRRFIETASTEDEDIIVSLARPKLSAPIKNVPLGSIKRRPTVLNMQNDAKETAIKMMEECIEKLKSMDETS